MDQNEPKTRIWADEVVLANWDWQYLACCNERSSSTGWNWRCKISRHSQWRKLLNWKAYYAYGVVLSGFSPPRGRYVTDCFLLLLFLACFDFPSFPYEVRAPDMYVSRYISLEFIRKLKHKKMRGCRKAFNWISIVFCCWRPSSLPFFAQCGLVDGTHQSRTISQLVSWKPTCCK